MDDFSQQTDFVIAEYLQAVEAGGTADREQLLDAHPELQAGLRSFFDSYDQIQATVSPKQTAVFRHGDLLGRYKLVKTIGEGAFGHVWLGFDTELKRAVAIKVPTADRFRDAQHVDAFLSEARLLARVEHPGIVPIYDVGRADNGCVYLVSRYIAGCNLAVLMERERLSFVESARLIAGVADALQFAHGRRLVHRDVKPSNILMESNSRTPFVTDFGLAILGADDPESRRRAGTPAYMSPEQVRCDESRLDHRSDLFSLGVVLYQMLTGTRPFTGRSAADVMQAVAESDPMPPRQRNESIPTELESICVKALAKVPSERFSSAQEMAGELRRWLASIDVSEFGIKPTGIPAAPGFLGSTMDESDQIMSASVATASSMSQTGGRLQQRPSNVAGNANQKSRAFRQRWLAGVAVAILAGLAITISQVISPVNPVDPDQVANTAVDAGLLGDLPLSVAPDPLTDVSLDRRMAIKVLSLGGTVDVTYGVESREIEFIDDLPDGDLTLGWIMMPKNKNVDAALIREFRGLNSLIGVDFHQTGIGDAEAEELSAFTSLTHIYLHNNDVTDRSVTKIATLPKLQQLVVSNTAITDDTLRALAGNRSLQWLDASDTRVTDEGIHYLADVRFLQTLDIGRTSVTDKGLAAIAGLKHVHALSIDETRVTLEGLKFLAAWPLKELRVSEHAFSDEAITYLEQEHPDCYLRID